MSETNRIDARFAALKEKGQKAFIAFATAGYPNLNIFPELLKNMPKAGVDLIEIGMPFSDPMADGPVIQMAGNQALREGTTLPKILDMVRDFRKEDQETPIILMGYYNPIYSYGVMRFLDDAKEAGVDGFILPDVPPEEDEEFRKPAQDRGMMQIRLATPTTDDKRLPVVLNNAKGFLYYVSITGITGSASADVEKLQKHIKKVRAQSQLPLAIGFGVNTPKQAREFAALADGVIVGSTFVKRMAAHLDAYGKPDDVVVQDVLEFMQEMADAVHSV